MKIVWQPQESLLHSSVLIPLSSRLYISAVTTHLLTSWRLDPGVTCVFPQVVVAEVQVLQLGVGGESPAQVLDPPLAQEVP